MTTARRGTTSTTPPSTPLAMAEWAVDAGLWPVAITPYDAKGPSPGKAPIGKRWGVDRPDLASVRSTFRRYPRAGVGLKLGAEGRMIDLDVGRFHLGFWYDDRLAALGKTIIKGMVRPDGTIQGNPAYLGLEVRIGAPAGDARQLQTVVPPSIMASGVARRWAHFGDLLVLPAHVVADLLANAVEPTPEPRTVPPRARPADGRWTPEARAFAYLQASDPAVSGESGHDQTLKVCVQVGPGFDLVEDTAFRLILEVWNPTCSPPWSERELRRKVSEAYKVEPRRGWMFDGDQIRTSAHVGPKREPKPDPGPEPEGPKIHNPDDDGPPSDDRGGEGEGVGDRETYNLTDTGNALRLIRDHGKKLRYCVDWGAWLRWDGRRWKEDKKGSVYRLARKTVRKIGAEASAAVDPDERKALLKWALASESRKHLDAMVYLARFVEGIPVETSELDRDPWLLNVRNGTIDLRSGELLFQRPGDLITKLADVDYDPSATCPRWDQFELEIMDNDANMVSYLRRIAGYGITGNVREHQLYFFHGEGRNGKSLWLGMIHRILNDYATTINSSLITVKQHEDHPTGLADLEGKRFVSTIEVADGKKMAEALVNQLTGGDIIKARRMRQDPYEFLPTHKIILAANHKPDIRETGEAIWERVKLIPFPVTFVEPDRVDPGQKRLLKDKDLESKLWAEAPGILATLVRSCLEWQAEGMKEPAPVVEATAGYRAEMDRLTDFIEERCLVSPGLQVKTNAIYEAYRTWAKASGEHEMSKRKFGSNLERRGFINVSSNSTWYRRGIALKDLPSDTDSTSYAH